MNNVCPVCLYDELTSLPEDHLICPSCGTQFDYDDCTTSHEELRRRWVESGARWYSRRVAPPLSWSSARQLAKLNSAAFSPGEPLDVK